MFFINTILIQIVLSDKIIQNMIKINFMKTT